jgi:hypothetical protein
MTTIALLLGLTTAALAHQDSTVTVDAVTIMVER